MKYKATNKYGINGDTNHRTPEAALKAAARREGSGWYVFDDNGNRWDWNSDETKAVIV